MVIASQAVLGVSGHSSLQEQNVALLRSIQVRNPYIDPLNVIQAELLRRLRKNSEKEEAGGEVSKQQEAENALLQDALLITINGIANGMKNSG
jgi:phosphoenolpyruvate carboxylase